MTKPIQTEKAPAAAGPYSQAIEKDNFLFISGQLPINPETNEMSDDILEQTKQSLKNIESILTATNLELSNVVKNTIFVTSFQQFEEINEIYGTYFGGSNPARSMIGVKELPQNAQIEIESIAMR